MAEEDITKGDKVLIPTRRNNRQNTYNNGNNYNQYEQWRGRSQEDYRRSNTLYIDVKNHRITQAKKEIQTGIQPSK